MYDNGPDVPLWPPAMVMECLAWRTAGIQHAESSPNNGASKWAYLQGYVRISTLFKGRNGQIQVERVSGTESHSPES